MVKAERELGFGDGQKLLLRPAERLRKTRISQKKHSFTPEKLPPAILHFKTKKMATNPFLGEFIGTLTLILLGKLE